MIVRILARGKSFKGCADYLTHDADHAQTAERVAWTHTHNLANDNIPCAVNEMLWTARDAELLKQEAGIRAGGRATENPVKHLSLNWAPEDNPSREHMIESTEAFLRHMKWQEHQAIVVAHTDKDYAHVHVMLNVVNPETGLRLDDNFERRRAQAWALEYEREQGRIHCEQRLREAEAREAAMPRNIWMAFQQQEKEFERAEKSRLENESISPDDPKNRRNSEWEILKGVQRDERKSFFDEGKSEFSNLRLSIYREVRGEFRERWADFYEAKRSEADPEALAALKAQLVADQKVVLEERRDEACSSLRASRDVLYRELLDGQRDVRADLRTRQESGLDNTEFLQALRDRNAEADARDDSTGPAEAGSPSPSSSWKAARDETTARSQSEDQEGKSAGHADFDIRLPIGIGFGGLLDALFTDLTTLGSAHPSRAAETTGSNRFEAAAQEIQSQQQRKHDEKEAERNRQRVPWE